MDERNIRIPVDLNSNDKVINVKLDQEFDNLEILSLKITSSDTYARQCSDYGVIVGRVMLNSGFGVQNAKVNIFIPITAEDSERPEITEIYPFDSINATYPNGVRYNLLPRVRNSTNSSHRAVGNFPDPSDFSHYPQYVEVIDKYYKYTTVTNESGDYMIFGVPTGQHDIIMDFDLFDTNSFELSANDLVEQISLNNSIEQLTTLLNANANTNEDTEDVIYLKNGNIIRGTLVGQIPNESYRIKTSDGSIFIYEVEEILEITKEVIENANRVPGFKYLGNNNYEVDLKTNLNEMPNIFHQIRQITVSPFWGDNDACDVGITRCDFRINYNYTPTAIFFGFIQAPSKEFYIEADYNPIGVTEIIDGKDNKTGLFPLQKLEVVVYRLDDKLTPGSRKRLGVYTGSYYNGIFRITLPMYSDYYITDETGELVPTNETTLGIPTKGYYAFEIYDTDDGFTNRRQAYGNNGGGFFNYIVPGIRIPSTTTGDAFLGGWEGTWTGLFEYDILNRKRKYYTVKTIYKKHSNNNVLLPGNVVNCFPQFNPLKSNLYWNFPLSYDTLSEISEPQIIGSVLVPRFQITSFPIELGKGSFAENGVGITTPVRCLNEIDIDPSKTFNIKINDYEKYLGIGVKHGNGLNFGPVFTELFTDDDFIIAGDRSVFGEQATWNYGDNSTTVFIPSLYASSLARKKGSNANGQGVHKAFNQVVNEQYTYGVFINSVIFTNKEPLMEILIYDITDDLPDLIKDGVYSSYNKGTNIQNTQQRNNTEEIYVEGNQTAANTTLNNNSYKGNFYYFGLWKEANSLYDIEKNYFNR